MTTPGVQILVVEDDEVTRTALRRVLQKRGYQVEAVEDGASCLAMLERRIPDLILLDVTMPGLGGLEVLGAIRQQRSSEQLPVILVSAAGASQDVVAGLDAGANDYVAKPVNVPVLLARVQTALDIKRSVERRLEAERQREKLSALAEACHQLTGPIAAIAEEVQSLVDDADDATAVRLREVFARTNEVSRLIRRLQEKVDS